MTALRGGEFSSEDATEQAAYRVCRHLLEGANTLGDEEFRRFEARLGHSSLLELVVLVGYYRTLSQMMNVFDVGAPEGRGDE
jgi:4-carboxymuconolactone decarboxylase